MLCHPKTLTPPTQVVEYCGFLMDSRGIPCLCIPVGKRERALVVVKHLIAAPVDQAFLRLSLAVASSWDPAVFGGGDFVVPWPYLSVSIPYGGLTGRVGHGGGPVLYNDCCPGGGQEELGVVAGDPQEDRGTVCPLESLDHLGSQVV